MSAVSNTVDESIFQEMLFHPAWLGAVTGLTAEKMLRGKKTFLYVLRQGEKSLAKGTENFYVTFVGADQSIRHQPFTITLSPEGWYYENGGGGGPFVNTSMNDVLPMIMHCEKGQCKPLIA